MEKIKKRVVLQYYYPSRRVNNEKMELKSSIFCLRRADPHFLQSIYLIKTHLLYRVFTLILKITG